MLACGPLPPNTRHSQPIHRVAAVSDVQHKINYTVPANKRLFIEWWSICIESGDKLIMEIQDDGAELDCMGNGQEKSGGDTHLLPQFNPLGSESPIAAGSVVRISRVLGASNKDWGGGFAGYLEDV